MKTNSSLRGAGAVLSAITLGFGILSGVTPRTFAADCSSPPTGLVGWWRGEGDASDVTGSNGGTVVGATFVAGRVGQAFNFNGTGQKITLPDNDALKLTNSLTIEGWIFPRANGFILFRGDSRPGLDPYVLTIELTHELQLIVCNDSGGVLAFRTPGAVPMNQWLHVAATLDDATGDARLFVNGALAAQTNTTLRPFRDLDAAYGAGVAIGGHSGAYNYFSFDGMIDELSVYNRALATNEITAIYTAGTAGKCTAATPGDCVAAPAGAAGWWPGDNSPNDILGANHASINGGNNFAPGEVGNGFQFNSYSNYALIPAAPALDVGGGSGFSIEGWILPNDVAGFHPIWEWNGGEPGGATIGAHFWISHLPWSNGELFANIVGTDGSSHAFWSADGVVAPNVLQHVALTTTRPAASRASCGMARSSPNRISAASHPRPVWTCLSVTVREIIPATGLTTRGSTASLTSSPSTIAAWARTKCRRFSPPAARANVRCRRPITRPSPMPARRSRWSFLQTAPMPSSCWTARVRAIPMAMR